MDGGTIGAGAVLLISGAAAFFRPHKRYFESVENRERRMRELDAGAPESFFEERRALEAYPPKVNRSPRTIAVFGALMMLCGACMIGVAILR